MTDTCDALRTGALSRVVVVIITVRKFSILGPGCRERGDIMAVSLPSGEGGGM